MTSLLFACKVVCSPNDPIDCHFRFVISERLRASEPSRASESWVWLDLVYVCKRVGRLLLLSLANMGWAGCLVGWKKRCCLSSMAASRLFWLLHSSIDLLSPRSVSRPRCCFHPIGLLLSASTSAGVAVVVAIVVAVDVVVVAVAFAGELASQAGPACRIAACLAQFANLSLLFGSSVDRADTTTAATTNGATGSSAAPGPAHQSASLPCQKRKQTNAYTQFAVRRPSALAWLVNRGMPLTGLLAGWLAH